MNNLLILTIGVFSIINTEMGVIGILPLISSSYGIDIATAGLLVSLFALTVAISGPTLPLLFSRYDRKKIMILVLTIFLVCNIISAFAMNFNVVVIARVLPAFFHPVYVSLAFSVASSSVKPEDIPKSVSKIMIGVSAGMVLGVPIVSYIASITSLKVAMLSFALVNAIALIATILFIPPMPVRKRLSYGAQLGILKELNVWISIIAVIFLNGAIFGVYSYLAEYLASITKLSDGLISIMLLVYGLANIIGNVIAGRLLSNQANRFVVSLPFVLIGVYIMLFYLGQFTMPMAFIILAWGVLAGAGANINQYWITSAAPHVPDFANGLFLVATNLGTSMGAVICGFFISQMGTEYIVFGGILFLVLSIIAILFRTGEQKGNGVLLK